MNIGLHGENLIFLISQPRSGSTLTQRILGSHPDIYTVSEPWVMLPPLYGLRYEGIESDYNYKWAKVALKEFCKALPNGEETYLKGIGKCYSYLYSQAMINSKKTYFLEKTPRYYYIIPELYKTFPKAKFILLYRNPLAVLSSICNRQEPQHDWSLLSLYKDDLIKAPFLMLKSSNIPGFNCIKLKYEDLLINPEVTLKNICHQLGVEFESKIIDYGSSQLPQWIYGDQNLLYEKNRPYAKNLDKWILYLKDPKIWQASCDYLEFLGKRTIYRLGYSYENLKETLDKNRPNDSTDLHSIVVKWLDSKSRNRDDYMEEFQSSFEYLYHAKELEASARLTEAVAAYRKAIQLNPKSPWIHYHLGKALTKLQKWDEVIAAYQQAIKLNPSFASFYYNLGDAFIQQGSFDEAINQYSKAIAIKPSFWIGYNSLGEVLAQQGKLTEAVGCFRKAVELNSNYFRSYCNLAEVLAEKGQLEEAVDCYEQAIKINPSYQIINTKLREAVK